LVLFGLTGVSIAGAAPLSQSQKGPKLLKRSVVGVSGTRALNQLSRFTIAANGTRWVFDEGFDPGVDRIGPFEVQIAYDIAADTLRLNYTAESRGVKRPIREVIAGQLGYIEGIDANGGQPSLKAMSSERWASIRKHQGLMCDHQMAICSLTDSAAGGTRLISQRPSGCESTAISCAEPD
jgi:hypothetical protein